MRLRLAHCWILLACLTLPCLGGCGDRQTGTSRSRRRPGRTPPEPPGRRRPGHARTGRHPRRACGAPSTQRRLRLARRAAGPARRARLVGERSGGPLARGARQLRGRRAAAGALAREPGTVGIKVADEIGYHDGLASPAQALRFLRDVHQALGAAAPGTPILVDAVVLELGCLPRISGVVDCVQKARADAPAATVAAVTAYLQAGLVDRLDLSTGLGDAHVYPEGDLAAAQDCRLDLRGCRAWPALTKLQARKALAERAAIAARATADVDVYVDTPRRPGARAVDIWTWRQYYQDEVVSPLRQRPDEQPPVEPLVAEHRRGVPLFTHMTPGDADLEGRDSSRSASSPRRCSATSSSRPGRDEPVTPCHRATPAAALARETGPRRRSWEVWRSPSRRRCWRWRPWRSC